MKENIDLLLADAFKELVCKQPIEKITVKEITDKAGVIRPTFYNHFQDKYELLEWIIRKQILEPVNPLISAKMIDEALLLIFHAIREEKEFYNNAVKLEGQNSFERIVRNCIEEMILEVVSQNKKQGSSRHPWLDAQHISQYYAQSMCFVVVSWIKSGMQIEPQEITDIYNFIITRSMDEVLREL